MVSLVNLMDLPQASKRGALVMQSRAGAESILMARTGILATSCSRSIGARSAGGRWCQSPVPPTWKCELRDPVLNGGGSIGHLPQHVVL